MRTCLLTVFGLCLTCLPTGTSDAQDPADAASGRPGQVKALMRGKLERSKEILEGLATEDYQMISKNAHALKLFSLEAGWNVVQTKEYQKKSEEFRRTCDSIEESAKKKDVSRATLGYVSLTMQCVECHRYMRENRLILSKLPSLKR